MRRRGKGTERGEETLAADVDAVVAALRASRKYRYVAEAAISRTAEAALRSARGRADAVKRAKRKLHQIVSAFVTPAEIERAERIVATLAADAGEEELRAACVEVLKRHSSSRERVATPKRARAAASRQPRGEPDASWYARVWKITGTPRRVLDLGCGFHPFALPWMGLPDACDYLACDVDERIAALVARLLERSRRRGRALVADLVASDAASGALFGSPTDAPVDVAFAMKLLPTLERQEEGAASRLLARLPARFLVVTFPSKSLSGRERGMAANYEAFLREQLERSGPRRFGWAIKIDGDEPAWVVPRETLP